MLLADFFELCNSGKNKHDDDDETIDYMEFVSVLKNSDPNRLRKIQARNRKARETMRRREGKERAKKEKRERERQRRREKEKQQIQKGKMEKRIIRYINERFMHVNHMFQSLDENNDGFLSLEEIKTGLQKIGLFSGGKFIFFRRMNDFRTN